MGFWRAGDSLEVLPLGVQQLWEVVGMAGLLGRADLGEAGLSGGVGDLGYLGLRLLLVGAGLVLDEALVLLLVDAVDVGIPLAFGMVL